MQEAVGSNPAVPTLSLINSITCDAQRIRKNCLYLVQAVGILGALSHLSIAMGYKVRMIPTLICVHIESNSALTKVNFVL